MANEITRLKGRWWGLAALTISGLVLGLDVTILVTALPTLSAKLGATTDELQWMSAAYTLSLAGFMLPAGVLGDRFGRKLLLLIGLVTFGISSVVASQMTSAAGLILMRVVMGASGAIVLPLMQSMLPSMFAPDERQRAIGFAGAGSFIGLPLGPLLAGWLLTHYEWGSIFLINAPVVVIAVIGAWLFVPESKDPNPKRLDWFGAALEVAGVTGLVYGIIEEPVHGWSDPQVIGPIFGGALLLIAFVAWQLRTRIPLVDLNLFRNRRFAMATVAFTVVGFAMTGVMFVLSPYLQVVQGNDAQGTGLRLLPMIAALMVGAVSSDWLAGRLGARVMVSLGLLGNAMGMFLLSRATADTGYGLVAVSLCGHRAQHRLCDDPVPRRDLGRAVRRRHGRRQRADAGDPERRGVVRRRHHGEHPEQHVPGSDPIPAGRAACAAAVRGRDQCRRGGGGRSSPAGAHRFSSLQGSAGRLLSRHERCAAGHRRTHRRGRGADGAVPAGQGGATGFRGRAGHDGRSVSGAGASVAKPGLRERKKQKTREAIQREAMRLFQKNGYEETTIEQIAAAVEISPSTFFNYFPSKEDVVLYDAYDPMMVALLATRPADEPLSQAVRAVLTTIGTALEKDRDVLYARFKLVVEVPELRARVWEELERAQDFLGNVLAARTGRDPQDFESRVVIMSLVAAMMEAAREWVRHDGKQDLSALLSRAFDLVDAGARLDTLGSR